ncbi:MAG: PTS-dependent dihydroxyacetone kinase phosphotransferase subunit DhaM [Thermoproteales archaeon]|nr:PTS-dependent dihydroxyacetone kinase phosphotransferase subunit DhaM [Thermoproteales archaeon]
MVGIVIVSHSKKLAEGVKELIEQMVKGEVKIEAVGGVAVDPKALGTDPLRVKEAILKVMDEKGVLILGDFGSAILSARMALNMLPQEIKDKIAIANAPLVEGAFTAAVEASTGEDLETVKKVAEEARNLKKI